MPPVKRFSVSFARHPTNGMSAFIQVYFDPPPVFLLSCMTFLGDNISCVPISWGFDVGCVITLNVSTIEIFLHSFCFTTHPWCLLYLVLDSCSPLTPAALPAPV